MLKKRFCMIYILLLLVCIISAQENTNELIFKEVKFSEDGIKGREILNHYGNLWIGYKQADTPCIFSTKKYYPVTIINFFYKNNDDLFFLGKIDMNGIYDKNSQKLCSNTLKKERFNNISVLGFTEDSIEDPFYTSQFYKNNETGKYGCSEPYAFFTIDFETDSLKLIQVRE